MGKHTEEDGLPDDSDEPSPAQLSRDQETGGRGAMTPEMQKKYDNLDRRTYRERMNMTPEQTKDYERGR